MNTTKKTEPCCPSSTEDLGCCHIEGVVHVDSRGQIVLPKVLRDKMKISEGDRLIVISMREKGVLSSISLMKADKIDGMVKVALKPIMEELVED
ncbi:MAG: AbrB/MazE/SpoVT family DNA-binding domain-containing protein [Candidatus Heimdallarchaeota archaeon]|nr:AbrB/MazE/SpoVT family DNA-binding domain-containing protein [Candidatus Heimdallarchaeota archaeon]MCK5142195.1 AbrB/MazE/SpoVT family DNA-binding domain-containing protein [Candidatus Heimdallarchaeota archaeon]